MSVESAVANGRAAAERRMTSRCTLYRATGETAPDARGNEAPEWAIIYAALPMRLDSLSSRGAGGYRSVTIGGTQVEVANVLAHFPADTSDVQDRDLVLVTDGETAGRVYQVIKAGATDQKTARRVPVFEVQRPEEWA